MPIPTRIPSNRCFGQGLNRASLQIDLNVLMGALVMPRYRCEKAMTRTAGGKACPMMTVLRERATS